MEVVQLTQRQVDVLGRARVGRTNRQIGRELGIAEGTVRKHLENAYRRLGVDNRMAAVVRAFERSDPPGMAGRVTG